MVFVLSNREFEGSKKIGDFYFKGDDIFINKRRIFYFKGTLLPNDLKSEEAYRELLKNKFDLNKFTDKFDGDFYFIDYDVKKSELKIGNDRFAQNKLFYYVKKGLIIISDNFWEAIKIIKPTEKDINWAHIKWISYYGPGFYETMINNLKYLGPAKVYVINIEKIKIKSHSTYWHFSKRTNDKLTMDEIVSKVHNFFNQYFKDLKKKHGDKTIFAVGLSGGYDSRLFPYYFLKNKMRFCTFRFAKDCKRPFIKTADSRNVKKILKYYDITKKHTHLEYCRESIFNKLYQIIKRAPTIVEPIGAANYRDLPKFDILLNGTLGGFILGSKCPMDAFRNTKENIVAWFLKRYIRGTHKNRIKYYWTKDEEDKYIKKIKNKINSFKSNDPHYIVMRLFYENFSLSTKESLYSSIHNTKISYTPFMSNKIINFTEEIDYKYFIEGNLWQYFYITYFKELGKIPGEVFDAPISLKSYHIRGTFLRIYHGIRRMFLGGGTELSNWTKKNRKFRKVVNNILVLNNKAFDDNLFKKNDLKRILKTHPRIFESLIKYRLITYLIITNKYHNLYNEVKKVCK